jgi:folate-binding protein YgfZ
MSRDGWAKATVLADRGVIRLDGPEAREFLQGLVSNDVRRVGPERAIYAALLSPQGKYLFDFIIAEHDGALLLDTEAARLADLVRRLTMYKLRAKVTVADASGQFVVAAAFGPDALTSLGFEAAAEAGSARAFAGGVATVDPRLASLGGRLILPRDGVEASFAEAGLAAGTADEWDAWRLGLGVPDSSRDILIDKSFLLESNFEEMNGVDFNKGCYVGQETTTRSKFRGNVRKRIFRVEAAEGTVPPPGTPLMGAGVEAGSLREVGTMRSGRNGHGLAMVRLEELATAGGTLTAEGISLRAIKPDWVKIDEQ